MVLRGLRMTCPGCGLLAYVRETWLGFRCAFCHAEWPENAGVG